MFKKLFDALKPKPAKTAPAKPRSSGEDHSGSAAELPDAIHSRIVALCKEGDLLAKDGNGKSAREKYFAALALLPEPRDAWSAATWTFVAVGDTHFHVGEFREANSAFQDAVRSAGGLGNPYVHLRLGQCAFEAGGLDRAADELTRAYMGAGLDILLEDDPKYLAFLETRIQI
jgi:tetratricopeptide (TPR) repeat protein